MIAGRKGFLDATKWASRTVSAGDESDWGQKGVLREGHGYLHLMLLCDFRNLTFYLGASLWL